MRDDGSGTKVRLDDSEDYDEENDQQGKRL